jgi:hypothetical protein
MTQEKWDTVVKNLERQDLHRMLRDGMSDDVAQEVKSLCMEYIAQNTEMRTAMKSAITRKASSALLYFTSRMATLAMQRLEKEAIDLGLAAFDLSNIMQIDPRDAFAPVGRLVFAAKLCDVDLLERAKAIFNDISPQLMKIIANPRPAQVARDAKGNLIFETYGR